MFVKCDDHTKSILHAFGFDALALVNVNFPGLFPRLLQVNVNLGLFHFILYFRIQTGTKTNQFNGDLVVYVYGFGA